MRRAQRRTKNRNRSKKGALARPNHVRVEPRAETEVFEDLRKLAQSPGFIHALAALTFKSNVVTAQEKFTAEDFLKIYAPDRLIRTETNLLIGLMLSGEVDVAVPDPQTTQDYIDRSIALLEELHQAILAAGQEIFVAALKDRTEGKEVENPLSSGVMLREAIFYGGESAFTFQYEALARKRYAADRDWLLSNMGFDIDEAAEVLGIIRKIVDENFPRHLDVLRKQSPLEWSWLPLFVFTIEDVLGRTELSEEKVLAIVDAFSVQERDQMLQLKSASEYNKAASHPIVRLRDGTLLSFLEYGAFAALYENPFYWITQDATYLGKHSQTRGSFVEVFTEKTLCRVFPGQYVHKNVVLKSRSGEVVGEADAILLYGYRAFVVQAKAKRLTLQSWQGVDAAIAKDFQSAVQHAYDQAIDCIRHIKNGVRAYSDGKEIDLHRHEEIREFYPICITSEHYPALSFQSGILLKLQTEPNVLHPIITDVFTLDVIAEMLPTPLYFTDYLVKRSVAADKLHVSHELVALAWYIKRNLHIEGNEFFSIADDVMVELDLAMAVRRLGIEGNATPEGQLTRFIGTPAGKILDYVNATDRPDVHRLGEIILGMNGETGAALNQGISKIVKLTAADSKQHDVTIGLKGGGGISIHCNEERPIKAKRLLETHCAMRKYVEKADRWYGVTVDQDGEPIFMLGMEFPWKFDSTLESEAGPYRIRSVTHSMFGRRKIGRNEPCPCGSGKKYKKCCLN